MKKNHIRRKLTKKRKLTKRQRSSQKGGKCNGNNSNRKSCEEYRGFYDLCVIRIVDKDGNITYTNYFKEDCDPTDKEKQLAESNAAKMILIGRASNRGW